MGRVVDVKPQQVATSQAKVAYPRWIPNPNAPTMEELLQEQLRQGVKAEIAAQNAARLYEQRRRVLVQNHQQHSELTGINYGPDGKPVTEWAEAEPAPTADPPKEVEPQPPGPQLTDLAGF